MLVKEPSLLKLVNIFNGLFLHSDSTCLQTGAKEPFYQAPADGKNAIIHTREDFFSSALHEIAHWTLAGNQRRKIDDFGYWYRPEGRTKQQQLAFEQVEIKPQAIEWILSLACRQPFHVSADNLTQNIGASADFKQAVYDQANRYFKQGLPDQAETLYTSLCQAFRSGQNVSACELTNDQTDV